MEQQKEIDVMKARERLSKRLSTLIGTYSDTLLIQKSVIEAFSKARKYCPYMSESDAIFGFETAEFIECSHKGHKDAGFIIHSCSVDKCPISSTVK